MITEIFYPEYRNAYPSARIDQRAPDNFKLTHPVVLENVYKQTDTPSKHNFMK